MARTDPLPGTHLTVTGFYAGQTFCGAPRSGHDVHATYAPEFWLTHPNLCPDCRKLWEETAEERWETADPDVPSSRS